MRLTVTVVVRREEDSRVVFRFLGYQVLGATVDLEVVNAFVFIRSFGQMILVNLVLGYILYIFRLR